MREGSWVGITVVDARAEDHPQEVNAFWEKMKTERTRDQLQWTMGKRKKEKVFWILN